MYATKRRRRSLKGNNKLCLTKGAYNPVHSSNGSGSSSLKSNPSKRHRERLNSELERIASLLPFEANILSKLDKLSILRLSVSYLRIKSYFQAIQLREQAYGGYDGPTGHKSASDHFSLDPSLSRTDSVLKALNGFVLVLTTQGEVFFASSNIEEFLGFHQSDVIHQSVYELIHSEDRVELQKQLSWLGSPASSNARINQHDSFLTDNFQHLERCLTARFRCLLDNTSGFLRLEIRGRIGILHGQNFHSAGESPPGLLAICTPFGPATLPDNIPKDSVFKSKLKPDLSIINVDNKGKELLGWAMEEGVSVCRSFYNCLHPDDILYAASAHRELAKTNSCVMYAHRMSRKTSPACGNQWQWVQTTMKIIPKNGKPDHVSAAHRPLSDEEGKDLMTKRSSITKLCDLDPEGSLSLAGISERSIGHGLEDSLGAPSKANKAPKKRSSPANNRENNAQYTPPLPANSRRRKSFSSENISTRNGGGDMTAYSSVPYHSEASLNYCAHNPYSAAAILDSARLFPTVDQCSLLPYPGQYGTAAGYYSATALPVSDSVNGTALLDRPYDLYAAAYGPEVLSSSGDYLKSYYKGMDSVFPVSDSVSRLAGNGSYPNASYTADSTTLFPGATTKSSANGWIASSHHRQSVVVWNNNSRPEAAGLAFKNTWSDSRHPTTSYPSTAPSMSAFSTTDIRHANNQILSTQRSQDIENNKATSHLNEIGVASNGHKSSQLLQSHNFSICEATNTMLETAG